MTAKYTVLGVMSGTSLDGIDLALCEFKMKEKSWKYNIISAETIEYKNPVLKKILDCQNMSGYDLLNFHNEFGNYIGAVINNFLLSEKNKPDFISSHGHTIFHTPDKGLTFQIGNGSNIAATTQITTISDFRTFDVALGGQGAPLVPIGDELLFNDYDCCINIGGFANTSFKYNNERVAYDICPANILFNHFANKLNYNYDIDGNLGRKGKKNLKLLKLLNSLPYYNLPYPKSLGKEWVIENVLSLIQPFDIEITDILSTLYEHVAGKIAESITNNNKKKILLTGGGILNKFLFELIKSKTSSQLIIPDKQLVLFKEALIFAFLGVLRIRNEYNCLSSVTGANQNNIGGVIHII